ncbi:hypothetical protein EVJ33_07395 [Exiguobacterium sp. SL-10]|uniref:hypothetical protein n=1 Tax=Exiguobacterium sp. SL-10 TaxID=2510962 RepID=UPI00103F3456|nr:hypothetical protein [Exiguobacterium sp. SL-10]TCI29957.1 hypothetical protein EVJ33_07395 [Exiguobacterium sp. SL-10]
MFFKKTLVSTIVFAMLVLGISPHASRAETTEPVDQQSEILKMLSDENDPLVKLLDEIPMEIAEQGPARSVEWLNEHNAELKGIFIADGEFVKFMPVQKETPSVRAMAVSGACVWAVTKAIGLNFIPWAKILKVKTVAKSFGGLAQLTKLVYTSYKHQRNLGLGQKNAIKKAVRLVLGKKGFGETKIEAVYQFFEMDAVVEKCFL